MKTPEEIKKGLECSITKRCIKTLCPYFASEDDEGECISQSQADALAYIKQLEEREWELFDDLSRAWYGKTYYYKQDDGAVYSSKSCDYMTLGEAIDEFRQTLIDSNDMP